MGACSDQIEAARAVLLREANGVSDNPLVFTNEGADSAEVLSGGNFHAEPVAFAADNLALAVAEIGALSERRIALLIDATLSGLPPFLVRDGGVNSGFMIAHVTAAALASENKLLAHPASVDSLPTSANQEDHVSMATFAARKLGDLCANTSIILAIELLAAAQGVDLRAPILTSARLQGVMREIRARVPHYDIDRYLAPDIAAMTEAVRSGVIAAHAPKTPGMIPVEFLIFGVTLLGVALFHRHTLGIALARTAGDHRVQDLLRRFPRGSRGRGAAVSPAVRMGAARQPVRAAGGIRAAVAALRAEPPAAPDAAPAAGWLEGRSRTAGHGVRALRVSSTTSRPR